MARIKDNPNKVKAKLIVEAEAEFYDNESSEETLRYCVEQDLEDAGLNVIPAVLHWESAYILPLPFAVAVVNSIA